MTRAVVDQQLFVDDADRESFLAILAIVVSRCGWHVNAYCLMGTHYHLLITTPEANLSDGMRYLNGWYAQSFYRRHRRRGHLFGERYASLLVESDAHLAVLHRYIASNPSRAGLCERARDWRWSSYAAAVGLRRAPAFVTDAALLRYFGGDADVVRARKRLRAFVEEPRAGPRRLPLRLGERELAAELDR